MIQNHCINFLYELKAVGSQIFENSPPLKSKYCLSHFMYTLLEVTFAQNISMIVSLRNICSLFCIHTEFFFYVLVGLVDLQKYLCQLLTSCVFTAYQKCIPYGSYVLVTVQTEF